MDIVEGKVIIMTTNTALRKLAVESEGVRKKLALDNLFVNLFRSIRLKRQMASERNIPPAVLQSLSNSIEGTRTELISRIANLHKEAVHRDIVKKAALDGINVDVKLLQ